MKRIKIFILLIAMFALFAAPAAAAEAKPKAKPAAAKSINVTGTWNTNMAGGKDLLLHQEGNLGWGDEQPLVSNDTEEGMAINRRVEITVER